MNSRIRRFEKNILKINAYVADNSEFSLEFTIDVATNR